MLLDDGDVDAGPAADPTSTQNADPLTEAAQEPCVLCPHGLVDDPYPGRCRRYTDQDGDGVCDFSVPQVCG